VFSGKCGKIISYGFEWAFRYQLFFCGCPIELDKPHILALAAETGFLLFKEQVPLKFRIEISAVQWERKTFRLILLSTPVGFRWTVPFSWKGSDEKGRDTAKQQ
jgi:hypothetical protein